MKKATLMMTVITILLFSNIYNETLAMTLEDAHQIITISEEYGVPRIALTNIRNSGVNWDKIKEYLEEQYPKPRIRFTIEDCKELNKQTGIKSYHAVTALLLAEKYRRDPVWIASLYIKNGNWEKIKAALERREHLQAHLFAICDGREDIINNQVENIAAFYGISIKPLQEAIMHGMSTNQLVDILFIADAESPNELNKIPLCLVPLPNNWIEVVNDMIRPVNTVWPVRQYPNIQFLLSLPQMSGAK